MRYQCVVHSVYILQSLKRQTLEYNLTPACRLPTDSSNTRISIIHHTWPKDEPRQDGSDVGWETERGVNIRLKGKDIKQVKNCVYLGGNISENGRVDVEVRRRIQAGANAWRNVEGGNGGQKDFQKTEGEGPGFLCGAS